MALSDQFGLETMVVLRVLKLTKSDDLQRNEIPCVDVETEADFFSRSSSYYLDLARRKNLSAKRIRAKAARLKAEAERARQNALEHEAFALRLSANATELAAEADRCESAVDDALVEAIRWRKSIRTF